MIKSYTHLASPHMCLGVGRTLRELPRSGVSVRVACISDNAPRTVINRNHTGYPNARILCDSKTTEHLAARRSHLREFS
jgi:hypothetical protein